MAKVYYHKNCVDGFGSAFACWLNHPDWDYQPIQYGEDHLIEELKSEDFINGNDTVYFLDFCPKYEVIKSLFDEGYSVFIIDHHLTQQAVFHRCLQAGIIHHDSQFSLEKSGAMLAYDYFKPVEPDADLFFRMIQDRDLWKFEVIGSKALHAFLISNLTFESFQNALYNISGTLKIGIYLLRQTDSIAEKCCKGSYYKFYNNDDETKIPMVNSPIHQSEICDKLLKMFPEAKYVGCEYRDEHKWYVSLRSRKDFDCSVIAKHYGGGGHAQASGFTLSIANF